EPVQCEVEILKARPIETFSSSFDISAVRKQHVASLAVLIGNRHGAPSFEVESFFSEVDEVRCDIAYRKIHYCVPRHTRSTMMNGGLLAPGQPLDLCVQ